MSPTPIPGARDFLELRVGLGRVVDDGPPVGASGHELVDPAIRTNEPDAGDPDGNLVQTTREPPVPRVKHFDLPSLQLQTRDGSPLAIRRRDLRDWATLYPRRGCQPDVAGEREQDEREQPLPATLADTIAQRLLVEGVQRVRMQERLGEEPVAFLGRADMVVYGV